MSEQVVVTHDPDIAAERRLLYGIVAEFADTASVIEAARRVRQAGYSRLEAYSPFPVHGLDTACGHTENKVPWIMFAGGILGGLSGFGLIYFCQVIDYKLNIGGRPLYSWPTFIPITFEMTVLIAAISGIVSMFLLNGLPQPYHPLFDVPEFDRATSDRFFLCVEAADPQFTREETMRFMESLGALSVVEVDLRK